MALRYFDGFDSYQDSQRLLGRWSQLNANPQISSTSSRFGGQCLTNVADGSSWVRKIFDAQATWIVGGAWFTADIGSNQLIFSLLDGTSHQCDLRYVASVGKFRITRNGTTLADGTFTISQSVYYYLEFEVTIGNSGSAKLYINEAVDINFSGDTQDTSNATADRIQLHGSGSNRNNIDDFYIEDGTDGTATQGSPYNTRLGDVRVESLFPNGNGTTSQLLGSDGNSTDNYLLVDEMPPDDDTTYVQSATVGEKDTYNYGSLTPTSGTVYGVQICPYAKKTDAGARSIKSVARLSGNESDGPAQTLATTYLYLPDIRTEKPGSGAWSITDVNNAEFGVKVNS